MTCKSILSLSISFLNAAAKNFVRPSEGVAGGGGWGEESRHAREEKESSQPRRPARQSRTPQKSFVFLLEEKIGRAQIRNSKQNFSVVWRELASGGGAASLVPFKVGSSKVQNIPHNNTSAFFRDDCLGASPLGSVALRKAQSHIIPRRRKRKGSGLYI